MKNNSRCLLAFSLLVLTSCSFNKKTLPELNEYIQASPVQKTVFETRLKNETAKIKYYSAMLQVTAKSPMGKDRFNQVVVFNYPTHLRLATYATSLNALANILIVENDSAIMADIANKTVFRSAASAQAFYELLSVPLSKEQLMLNFVGQFSFPNRVDMYNSKLYLSRRRGAYVFRSVNRDGLLYSATFDERFVLKNLQVFEEESEEFLAEVKYFYFDDKLESFQIFVEDGGVEINVALEHTSLNKDKPDASLFRFDIPQSFKVVDLESEE